jgi:hypothetical protein
MSQPFRLNLVPPEKSARFARARIVADVLVDPTAQLLP